MVAQADDAEISHVRLRSTTGTGFGINSSTDGSVNVEQLDLAGFSIGIFHDGGTIDISDSLIDMKGKNGATGIQTYNANTSTSSITTQQVRNTIVGSGPNQIGLVVGADSAGEVLNAQIEDTLIFGSGANFFAGHCHAGAGTIALGFSRWASNANIGSSGVCNFDAGERVDLGLEPPAFRDFAGGDYRLRFDSPLVDRALTTTSGWTDVRNRPRQVDGNGDGNAQVDIGAHEYQRSTPTVSVAASVQQSVVGGAINFSTSASDADDEILTYSWTVDGALATSTGSSLSTAFDSAGTHTVAVTVTDESGLSGAASATVQVVSEGPLCPAVRRGFKVKQGPKKSFKRGSRGFKISKKAKQPYFEIRSDGVAPSAIITVQSVSSKKKLKNLRGTQSIKLARGTNRIVFGGKWNKKKLKKGTYKVTFTPVKQGACPATGTASVTLKLK